jgi:hypothetical protein
MGDVEQKVNKKNGVVDQRSGFDRRRKKFPSLKELLNYQRRYHVRRKDDRQKIFVFDSYSNAVVLVFIAILLLSLCDAFLTLFLLSIGAVELNPIMAYYININESIFVFVKYGLTVLSAGIILTLPYPFIQHLRIPMQYLLNCFAAIFLMVVVWDITLIITNT